MSGSAVMGVSIQSGAGAKARGQPVARVWGHSCRVRGQLCPGSRLRNQGSTSGQAVSLQPMATCLPMGTEAHVLQPPKDGCS